MGTVPKNEEETRSESDYPSMEDSQRKEEPQAIEKTGELTKLLDQKDRLDRSAGDTQPLADLQ